MKTILNKVTGLSVLLLVTVISVYAQHNISLKIKLSKPLSLTDTIYAAGNFNNWDPAKTALLFSASDSTWQLNLKNVKGEVYQFKFTRGSWDKVEVTVKGMDIENHVIQLSSDTILNYHIAAWKDDFAVATKKHTASAQVSIIDTAFYLPQLNRKRRIWIYLPDDYEKSKKHYPVLYMQDGQNLFDAFTSGYGEWGIDELLDSMQKQSNNSCIVVGIDNGPKRLNEYNPYDNEKFGKGEGKEYVDFLVKTLKPFIDRNYRTKTGKENTLIAGSSMGGLISYYAALTQPEVFGKAGIFSPSFWIAPQILALTDSLSNKLNGKLFFYIGRLEGQQYEQDMINVMDKLGSNSSTIIYSAVDPYGNHNEQAWKKWFPEFYKWMMADWKNYIIRQDD